MATRNVVVASPAANRAEKIENFTGSTFGDLKRNSTFSSLYRAGVEAILSPGNVTLNREDAELPETDFRVFLVTAKNKSGIGAEAARTLGEEISQAIQKAAKIAEEEDVEALRRGVLEGIQSFFDIDLSKECGECDDALEQARELEHEEEVF